MERNSSSFLSQRVKNVFLFNLFVYKIIDFSRRNNERWRKYEKEIENLIFEIAKVGDHSVLLLTWASLHASLNDPDAIENYNKNYSELSLTAFESCVFSTLYRVARTASGFNCVGGKLILSSIFTLYNNVCYNFNDGDFMIIQKDSIELLLELFKEEQLAKCCFSQPEQPIKAIFTFAMKVFPFKFTFITNFAITLVSHRFYAKKVCCKHILPFFCSNFLSILGDGNPLFYAHIC